MSQHKHLHRMIQRIKLYHFIVKSFNRKLKTYRARPLTQLALGARQALPGHVNSTLGPHQTDLGFLWRRDGMSEMRAGVITIGAFL